MADDDIINNISQTPFVTDNEVTQPENAARTTESSRTGALSQDEFLMLLVNQLQNQDPLDPMKNEEFAVQLAQFSQVEQLIGINDKLDNAGSSSSQIGSLASFLGHNVVLGDSDVSVSGGKGPDLLIDVPAGYQSGRVDFLDADGAIVGSYDLADDLESGNQIVGITGADIPNGTYQVRPMFVGADGRFSESKAKITGTVEGFIMEPEPKLLVGGQEFSLEEITEVYRGKS